MNLKKFLLSLPVAVLIFINLIPLAGVLYYGWDQGELLFLYWSESLVVGFYAIVKILMSRQAWKTERKPDGTMGPMSESEFLMNKLVFILFFIIHFGLFMEIHLLLILVFFSESFPFINVFDIGPMFFRPLDFMFVILNVLATVWLPLLGFFLSHGFSFIQNYLGRKEYEKAVPDYLFWSPYPRVILMHFAVMFAFLIKFPLLVIVLGKIVFDIAGHLIERTIFSGEVQYSRT